MARLKKLAAASRQRAAAAKSKASNAYDLRDLLFPRQREVIERLRTGQFHGVCCPRRSGKTNLVIAALFLVALETGLDVVYVGLTRKSAKKTVWEPPKGLGIVEVARRLGCVVNRSDLSVTLPNGAHVYVEGILDERVKERFRGQSYALVVQDECQSIAPDLLGPFVESVLEPTIADNGGRLLLAGTPSEFCTGLFWEVVGERSIPKYQVHTWHWEDNPHVRDQVRVLAEERRQRYGDDDPVYLREYCGRWVPDRSSLCLPNFSAANEYTPDQLPPIERLWYSTIGVDIGGGGDGDPAVVVRCDVFRDDPRVFASELTMTDGAGKLTDTHILDGVRRMSQGRRVVAAAIDSVIAIGPAPDRDFPLAPARKLEKAQQMRRIDDDFFRSVELPGGGQGRILMVPRGSRLAVEARTVFWDKKQLAHHKKVPTGAVPNDHLDALQYAYTELVNLQAFPPAPKSLQERMLEEARARVDPANQPRDWKSALLQGVH